jgi:uncharacterized protein (TIGR02757 family)
MNKGIKDFLDEKVAQFNRPNFIELDPISIPHRFSKKQDIEIAGFFAAILAWGQRKTILNKCNELLVCMDNAPHDFMVNHTDGDLKAVLGFKHRTFNEVDALYFIHFLSWFYQHQDSLEKAFLIGHTGAIDSMESHTDPVSTIFLQFGGCAWTNQKAHFFPLYPFGMQANQHVPALDGSSG